MDPLGMSNFDTNPLSNSLSWRGLNFWGANEWEVLNWVVVSNIFIFTPIWGNDPFWLLYIFQMGWNHQLVKLSILEEWVYQLGMLAWFLKLVVWKASSRGLTTTLSLPVIACEERCKFGPTNWGEGLLGPNSHLQTYDRRMSWKMFGWGLV